MYVPLLELVGTGAGSDTRDTAQSELDGRLITYIQPISRIYFAALGCLNNWAIPP
jgi:hypothetical protein